LTLVGNPSFVGDSFCQNRTLADKGTARVHFDQFHLIWRSHASAPSSVVLFFTLKKSRSTNAKDVQSWIDNEQAAFNSVFPQATAKSLFAVNLKSLMRFVAVTLKITLKYTF
jgi:hypothetical protein